MTPITERVVDYLGKSCVEVVDFVSLEVANNLEVGRLDPPQLVDIAAGLDVSRADAVILSACVQMQSLPAIEPTEQRLGLRSFGRDRDGVPAAPGASPRARRPARGSAALRPAAQVAAARGRAAADSFVAFPEPALTYGMDGASR
jgi:hypothetical protein